MYTQHQPLLYDTIDNINKGFVQQRQRISCTRHLTAPGSSNRRKVKDADYPYAGPALSAKERPQVRQNRTKLLLESTAKLTPSRQDIFIFVVGGATYEEARAVALLNAQNKNQRVILGSTCMLNSASFLRDFGKAAAALQ